MIQLFLALKYSTACIIPPIKSVHKTSTQKPIEASIVKNCNPNINTSEIYNAIETHNYKIFSKWFDVLEAQLPVEYLPIDAEIRVGGEYIGSVCVAFDEQVFKLITSQDHECG